MSKEPIGIIGAGWVGLVTAAGFARLGHEVCVRDLNEARISALSEGHVEIYEPQLTDLLEEHRQRIDYTVDLHRLLARARVVFVCVGTPSTASGDADLSAVWQLLDELPQLDRRTVLVMKSTVPVGTGAKVRRELDLRGLTQIGYVSNPEFLAEGTAIDNFLAPDRVVVGSYDRVDGDRVASLYDFTEVPVVRTEVASAELAKYASNAFLAMKISFINEIANVCEGTGADVVDIAQAMGLDHRIGRDFLRAGIGYGGSCFGKDLRALKQVAVDTGYHFQLVNAVLEVNEVQRRRVVNKLARHLGSLHGRRVALLGLAFKPNTNDLRDAPSLALASRLLVEGAEVRAWDPVCLPEARMLLPEAKLVKTIKRAVTGADAAVIVTEWAHLRDFASPAIRRVMRNPLIIDARNMLEPHAVLAAGFRYEAVGRPHGQADVFELPLEPRADVVTQERAARVRARAAVAR
jgi:UDPglucose 6-dehydrogenase